MVCIARSQRAPYEYCGYSLDADARLYDLRFRQYVATLGVFVTRDDVACAANDAHLFPYPFGPTADPQE
jgi:RHS repeat-associated protein